MKPKNFIILLLFAGSVAVSFFFSRDIYRLHMKTYYTVIKGYDYNSMMKKADEMNKNREYRKLHDFLKVILLIYNNRPETARLMGMNSIKLGDRKKGVEMIVSNLDGGDIDPRVIRETVVELYRQKLYGDIIDVVGRKQYSDDSLVSYYHGISLYHLKFYKKSIDMLKKAASSGVDKFTQEMKSDLYYYMALAYEETGSLKEALKYLDEAETISSSGKKTAEAMVRIYRKIGDYRRAEKHLRRQRSPR